MCEPSAFNPTSTFISISTSTSTFMSTPTSTSTTWTSTFISTSTSTQRPPHPPSLPPPLPQPEPLHLHLHLNHHFHLQLVECLYHGSVSIKCPLIISFDGAFPKTSSLKSQSACHRKTVQVQGAGMFWNGRNGYAPTLRSETSMSVWWGLPGVKFIPLEHVNHFYLSLFQVGQAIVENLFQLTLPACPRASLFPAQARIYKYSFPGRNEDIPIPILCRLLCSNSMHILASGRETSYATSSGSSTASLSLQTAQDGIARSFAFSTAWKGLGETRAYEC